MFKSKLSGEELPIKKANVDKEEGEVKLREKSPREASEEREESPASGEEDPTRPRLGTVRK